MISASAAASALQMHLAYLPTGIAAENGFFAQLVAQRAQAHLDGGVELPDRPVLIRLWWRARGGGLLDLKEQVESFGAEREQVDLDRPVAMRQRMRIERQQLGGVEPRRAAHGVEQVRRQRQMQHLLSEHGPDHLRGLGITRGIQRVQRAHVGRDGRVLQLDRPLQVTLQILQRADGGGVPVLHGGSSVRRVG
jgi:hypothetical protein